MNAPARKTPSLSLLRRALWHANRTQLAWVLKALYSALHFTDKTARRSEAAHYAHGGAALGRAAELGAKGYALVTDLLDAALLRQLEQESLERVRRADELAHAQRETHKSFWVRLLDEDLQDGAFDCDSAFVRFALQPGVIAVLANYLGELPRLMDVLLTYSTPAEEDLSYSQLWHRDFDDVRTVKLFVYLTDVVDLADGPFTFLPGPSSDRIGFTLRSHLPDEQFFRRAPREAPVAIRAPRLSTFLCETSRCFHMGSRVHPGHARLMYTATFISSPNVYPENAPRFRAQRPLSQAERLLLGV
jgi:hypothetical protein